MKQLLIALVLITGLLFPTITVAQTDENFDYSNDPTYQTLAEDFRMYSVCQSIHQNLAMFIAINYGVGSNLNFPTEFLNQLESLIQNIQGYERDFAEKLDKTMITLSMEFGFPMQGLQQQKANNQSSTTQQIIFSIAGSINDPARATQIIKNMLNESVKCRAHQSNYDYE
tara:strand:+ start:444 stop:953 length:510 start_codon:yes stop_codon:yes gene_type:complete